MRVYGLDFAVIYLSLNFAVVLARAVWVRSVMQRGISLFAAAALATAIWAVWTVPL